MARHFEGKINPPSKPQAKPRPSVKIVNASDAVEALVSRLVGCGQITPTAEPMTFRVVAHQDRPVRLAIRRSGLTREFAF